VPVRTPGRQHLLHRGLERRHPIVAERRRRAPADPDRAGNARQQPAQNTGQELRPFIQALVQGVVEAFGPVVALIQAFVEALVEGFGV
jgi:hypothetical protein